MTALAIVAAAVVVAVVLRAIHRGRDRRQIAHREWCANRLREILGHDDATNLLGVGSRDELGRLR